MMRLRKVAVLVGLPLGAIALAAGAWALTPDRTLTFVDDSGLTLTMQTDPAARDAGHFAFRVVGRGVYEGSAAAGMRALTPTSVVVDYSGPVTLRPIVDVNGQVTGSVAAPASTSVSLQAQIDPTHLTAEATLTDGSFRYHLVVAARGRADFIRAVSLFESAIGADDTTALYALMNSDIRNANTPAAFDQIWRAQETQQGRITNLTRVALSDVTTDAPGTSSAVATYTATMTAADGSVTTRAYDAYFLRQSDGWKLWYTSPR
jgi:hypothetical protein